MATFILEIAADTGRVLLDPIALLIPALALLTLVTGLAARLAVAVEDLWYDLAIRRNLSSPNDQSRRMK